MSDKLRAGIIACGRMSYAHSRAYAAMPDVELVAGADISPEALARFRDEFGISKEHTYTDYVEMLEREKLDLISIVSLHHQHAEMTIKAAEYQPKAILCEKPMAVSLGEADAMIDACEAAGTRLIIGHQRRYNAQYVAAYRALKGGAIGDLVTIETHGHPFSSLMVDGTHTIDLARWYADEAPIAWVLGQIDWTEARSGWGTRVENAAMFMYGFENGLRAWHTCGGAPVDGDSQERNVLWPAVTGPNYHWILLRGTEGEIWVWGDSPSEGIPWVRLVRGGHEEELPVPELPGTAHERLVRDMIDRATDGGPHTLDAASARDTLEVLMAAYESSRRRGMVMLPLNVAENPLFAMMDADRS
ncbi:MAG: Gfo/Idh/MocA family protein [Anaerolineae bacterium]